MGEDSYREAWEKLRECVEKLKKNAEAGRTDGPFVGRQTLILMDTFQPPPDEPKTCGECWYLGKWNVSRTQRQCEIRSVGQWNYETSDACPYFKPKQLEDEPFTCAQCECWDRNEELSRLVDVDMRLCKQDSFAVAKAPNDWCQQGRDRAERKKESK